MPQIVAQVPHHLGKIEAEARLRQLATELPTRQSSQIHFPESHWQEDVLCLSFTTYGFRVHWQLTASSTQIDMVAEIPIAARMFELKLEHAMLHRVEEALCDDAPSIRRAA
jgi:hypothetical protein